MRAPDFWHHDGISSRLLAPLGALYAAATARRLRRGAHRRMGVPVVGVGNLTAGGAGKTPVAVAIAERLRAAGREAHLLTRGYGGAETGPLRVDPARHDAAAVGDEALLLARAAPTWLARDRGAGARAAVAGGARALVLDDGHQNPALHKDVALVVVDGGYGFGNGRCIPAGPLREPIDKGLARASALVMVGPDRTGALRHAQGLPVLRARLAPAAGLEALAGRPVLAFAGIGRPAKFFGALEDWGLEVVARVPFPDHHAYRHAELARLLERAKRLGATPVTTAKDAVRLPAELREAVAVVETRLIWDDPARLDHVLRQGGVLS